MESICKDAKEKSRDNCCWGNNNNFSHPGTVFYFVFVLC